MSKVIIYTSDTGGVAVCVPTGELPIEAVQAKDCPAGSFIVEASSLADNDFFNAWEQSDGVVTVNMGKAKALTKDRLRAERAPLLAAQDVAYMRALEAGQDTSAIVTEKQRLRDVTNLADSASSLDDLRALRAAA